MKTKKLQIDVGQSTYTKLAIDPTTNKFYQIVQHIGGPKHYTEITRDDVLRKLTMNPHPLEWQRERNETNIKRYLPESLPS